jgi:hypothetical protein
MCHNFAVIRNECPITILMTPSSVPKPRGTAVETEVDPVIGA